jgi:hypothetical protein
LSDEKTQKNLKLTIKLKKKKKKKFEILYNFYHHQQQMDLTANILNCSMFFTVEEIQESFSRLTSYQHKKTNKNNSAVDLCGELLLLFV